MSVCDDFIKKMERALPEVCTVRDLIRVGLYKSAQAARMERLVNSSPSYLRLGSRILYPKDGVIKWLRKGKKEGFDADSKTADSPQGNEKNKNLCQSSRLETNSG